MSNSDIIGINNTILLILVNEEIIPNFLFDYKTIPKKRKDKILDSMKQEFPDLFYDKVNNYDGIKVSKKKYINRKNVTKKETSKSSSLCTEILSEESEKNRYLVELIVVTNMGHYIILTHICKNKSKIEAYKKIAKKAKTALNEYKYEYLLDFYGYKLDIEDIKVVVEKELNDEDIVDKLVKNIELTTTEKDKVLNVIFNYGFNVEFNIFFSENFQYENPIHRGILITFLLMNINDRLSPFLPLFNYPKQDDEISKITEKLEKHLTDAISKTRISY